MFGITHAPEIDRKGITWFNVAEPLNMAALRGRLVILDFWTFCCINCMHVLPTLRRVEEAFPREVAVIGIHSPKFAAERDPAKVEQAIRRYDIHHPVAHDPYMALWEEYGVRCWPTLVFISPDGHIIGQMAGEPNPDMLVQGVGDMVRQFFASGELTPSPLPLTPPSAPAGRLSFPGKIKSAADSQGTQLWAVADAGHHQVAVLDDQGREVARYGSGHAGFEDGPVAQATFNNPQGLICTPRFIYVADTGNHALRRINRADGMVSTLAGIGSRGAPLKHPQPGEGTALASPWDLELSGNQLFFANAGTHQLGLYDLSSGEVRPLAGNGGEDIIDGPAEHALLAQPSGLALADKGRSLYFADSETSSIRRVVLDAALRVETLVGKGLFEFGHVNGSFQDARLQHALGVAADGDGGLYVADSYNGIVRRLDLEARNVTDIAAECADPVCLPAGEPAGIAVAGPDRLLMSDTNNHRIVEIIPSQGCYRTWAA